jgi:hypothetical protein
VDGWLKYGLSIEKAFGLTKGTVHSAATLEEGYSTVCTQRRNQVFG